MVVVPDLQHVPFDKMETSQEKPRFAVDRYFNSIIRKDYVSKWIQDYFLVTRKVLSIITV